MNIDPSIFKSYDIRGVYPKTINEEIAEVIGMAFVQHFGLKHVAVGRDGRISSTSLEDGIVKGIKKAGADVTLLGLISTDMIYFASGNFDFDGGVMITASHNPKQYNGFKFTLKDAVPVSGEQGLYQMRDLILSEKLTPAKVHGEGHEKNIYQPFAKKLISLIDSETIKPLKVVADAGNGVGGHVLKQVFKYLPLDIVPLYFEVDGNFPNHQPSPIEEKNVEDLKKRVVKEEADLGLAFDGDGDRVYLVDENGRAISASVMTAMIAKEMLLKHSGSKVLHNLICGWIVPETIKKFGGKSVVTKVGHSLIKADMRKEDGLFAGEHSGHYYFKDLNYADSGLMAALIVIEIMSHSGKKLSEIAAEFDIYPLSGEINSEVLDQKGKLSEIKKAYSDGKISELDGISVEYDEWRFNVRPSNTEPQLRLNVEAKDKAVMIKKRDELLKLIRN